MKAMSLQAPGGLDKFVLAERAVPLPKAGEVQVRVHASSLNYHDYVVALGMLNVADGRIPMSDGAGEVTAVGEGVTAFKTGDRVVGTFFPEWQSGEATPAQTAVITGETIDGFVAEYVVAPERAFTKVPQGWSHTQAATLPCAGLTAWRGLVVEGGVKPGDTVLIQGTGGVSIFALQFAKAAGATVIATSSSEAKLERLRELGADHVINYRQEPEWGAKAKAMTGGRGVDHVIEIGGAGTMPQSIHACRMGGHIALIGVLAGLSGEVPTYAIFKSQLKISGVMVGSRAHQEDMIRALNATGMKPIIDSTYELAAIADAFRHQQSQTHFGKICLTI